MEILKFKPIFKERIWGGCQLAKSLDKKLPSGKIIGESWELSSVEGDVSVVTNGLLKGNSLEELIETYMGDLVGDEVYERFGNEFPLLIKFIDAQDNLSIQVHPDDEVAAERHNSYGKTEMWYVIDHQPGAHIYMGFNQEVDQQKYADALAKGTLEKLLQSHKVSRGDTYFIPAGTIHAIGKGVLIAEIQQTSDITYRVYDYNRVDDEGNPRELHTDLALDVINYSFCRDYKVSEKPVANSAVRLSTCNYFEINSILVNGEIARDYSKLDSFVIYVCINGEMRLKTESGVETTITKGETALVPAVVNEVTIEGDGKLLEVYIPYIS